MTHRLTVIGTGYLGATHAVAMASLGYEVLGLDVDADKIKRLSAGEVPFFEPGLEPMLREQLDSGRLSFTTSFEDVAAFGDVHFVCVGTPQKPDEYAADMTYIDAAIDGLAPHLTGTCVVVGKSTVPVRTAERLAARLHATAPAGADVHLCWNPEFLREGYAVQDTLHPDRLVFGVTDEYAEQVLREVYAPIITDGSPVVVVDLATAELVKVSANAFLATKISFINAMAEVCEAVGADVTALAKALSYDDRIGSKFLGPGLGFGGGCLPKDIRAFMARAGELGVDQALSFLREIDAINIRRRARMVDMAREQLGDSFAGKQVAVWGAAFKPNSDDIRDSPALEVADTMRKQGARVTVYDPHAMANARVKYPDLSYAESAMAAARDADLVLHLTEWPEFRGIDLDELRTVVRAPHILDGRNILDAAAWRAKGWTYRALGRP